MINKTKLAIKKNEHQFEGKHHKIDYLEFKEKNSKHMIVVFSGFNGKETQGAPGRYNYMRTLEDIKVNKLFIKDSVDNIPVYYMGENGSTGYLDDVCSLIEEKLIEMEIDKDNLILAGSSKGGTGALLIGLQMDVGHIIAGAHQLNVGTYLNSLNKKLKSMLFTKIVGHDGGDAPEILDRKFREKFLISNTKSNLYFHGGNRDSHYVRHMVPLLRHFDANDILYELDLRSYVGHDNVMKYFPEFFVRKVKEIITRTNLDAPNIKSHGDETEVTVKVLNPKEKDDVDWAIYVYRKDKKIKKIMYNSEPVHRIPIRYEDIRSVKVFLRINEKKVQTKEYYV
ncbi:accessory Sec system protein Asp2 [Salinicoccus roseus]|uniref:Uncharacterized protein n=1 Tax=Salinicoccus roseus TaxID=45670 RepID=A0A0C2HPL7_9STAP|nr:hypothetical protein [Salinicoccus roseus]KIH71456.1 hypothetical protein SN16_01885 [Salinicoccus roseus]MDB0579522.1 hypothetical protein [Salinicoccus roseus]